MPYEPYYKLQSSLLALAVDRAAAAGHGAEPGAVRGRRGDRRFGRLKALGGTILSQDQSPFGPVVRVLPPADWTALAQLPGVQFVEPLAPRVPANDLSRVTAGRLGGHADVDRII